MGLLEVTDRIRKARRMFKKVDLLTRPTPARRDAPLLGRGAASEGANVSGYALLRFMQRVQNVEPLRVRPMHQDKKGQQWVPQQSWRTFFNILLDPGRILEREPPESQFSGQVPSRQARLRNKSGRGPTASAGSHIMLAQLVPSSYARSRTRDRGAPHSIRLMV